MVGVLMAISAIFSSKTLNQGLHALCVYNLTYLHTQGYPHKSEHMLR